MKAKFIRYGNVIIVDIRSIKDLENNTIYSSKDKNYMISRSSYRPFNHINNKAIYIGINWGSIMSYIFENSHEAATFIKEMKVIIRDINKGDGYNPQSFTEIYVEDVGRKED